jgi:transposase
LPLDERLAVEQRLRELDRLGEDLQVVDRYLGQAVLKDQQVKRLLSINGVNATVAIGLVAAIGDIGRFATPQKLVSYFGLNPRVRQSGAHPAHHGRISKVGRSHARAMLVEAAWAAAKTPGPLPSFFQRIHTRRGMQIAAVATARKLATIVSYVLSGNEEYTWSRPALTAKKRRELELLAGLPTRKGQRGPAAEYSLQEVREKERAMLMRAERAYTRFVEGWKQRGSKLRKPPTAETG